MLTLGRITKNWHPCINKGRPALGRPGKGSTSEDGAWSREEGHPPQCSTSRTPTRANCKGTPTQYDRLARQETCQSKTEPGIGTARFHTFRSRYRNAASAVPLCSVSSTPLSRSTIGRLLTRTMASANSVHRVTICLLVSHKASVHGTADTACNSMCSSVVGGVEASRGVGTDVPTGVRFVPLFDCSFIARISPMHRPRLAVS
jgi:hypothetical protein